MLLLIFVTVRGLFQLKQICACFFYWLFICRYIRQLQLEDKSIGFLTCSQRYNYQEGQSCGVINWFNPVIFLCPSVARTLISIIICCFSINLGKRQLIFFMLFGGTADNSFDNYKMLMKESFPLVLHHRSKVNYVCC